MSCCAPWIMSPSSFPYSFCSFSSLGKLVSALRLWFFKETSFYFVNPHFIFNPKMLLSRYKQESINHEKKKLLFILHSPPPPPLATITAIIFSLSFHLSTILHPPLSIHCKHNCEKWLKIRKKTFHVEG